MFGAKSLHKVLNNEERSLVGYWASSALHGPQLSPCCNRVVRKGTQISETLSPCPSDLCKSNSVWRKLLWPPWSPGDTHLMFWNQHSGYKLPQRHRDLGRLWPQSHRVTSVLSRQVSTPCPAPPPPRQGVPPSLQALTAKARVSQSSAPCGGAATHSLAPCSREGVSGASRRPYLP